MRHVSSLYSTRLSVLNELQNSILMTPRPVSPHRGIQSDRALPLAPSVPWVSRLLNLYAMPAENSVEILRLLPMLSLSHDIRVKSGRKENGACLG
jgi:hypothetical protein